MPSSNLADDGRQPERIRRLEEARVIQGFAARINLRALGYSFETFVSIVVDSGKTSTSMVLSTQCEDRQRLPADEIAATG
jgi:DNA-binding Lrp family transcriptional regulator